MIGKFLTSLCLLHLLYMDLEERRAIVLNRQAALQLL